MTMNYCEEAAGIASACSNLGLPYVLVFTLETDSKLPNGDTLEEAIDKLDMHISSNSLSISLNIHPSNSVNYNLSMFYFVYGYNLF